MRKDTTKTHLLLKVEKLKSQEQKLERRVEDKRHQIYTMGKIRLLPRKKEIDTNVKLGRVEVGHPKCISPKLMV